MALTVEELNAMTLDYVEKRQPTDIYFTSNPLLWKLMKRGDTWDGGMRLQANLEYAKANTGSYGPKSELPVNKKEIFTAAFFPYAAYYATATIDMEDDILNSGEAQIVDLVQGKLNNMEKSIRDTLGSEIYAARSTGITADPKAKPFVGLADLFNTTSSTAYGEIKEDDLSLWKANAITGAKTMSFKFMQELRRTASIDTTLEGKPDLYVTTELLQDAFERTQQVQVRYSNKELLDAGFDNVLFKGAAVTADDNQTAGYIDALNLRYLKIKSHSKRNFTKPKWQSPIRQPDTATCNVRWAGQLLCYHRAAHCRATNVSEPA